MMIQAFILLTHSALFQGEIPQVRGHHSLVYDAANRRVLLLGGSTPLQGGRSFKFFNQPYAFDGRKWTGLNPSGQELSGLSVAYNSSDKRIYSIGGFSAQNQIISDFRVFDNGQWETVQSTWNRPINEAKMVYDEKNNRLVVFGGAYGRQGQSSLVYDKTWVYKNGIWSELSSPQSPSARYAHSMVYDTKSQRVLLYGGMDGGGTMLSDTWYLEGNTWTEVLGTSPGASFAFGMAFDSDRGVAVMFGGNRDRLDETWEFDGKNWRKVGDSGPRGRMMGQLAYDQNRKKTVLFGGRYGWPNDANDTWEWDGKSWTEFK